jgi:hypothetical protein
MKMAGKTAKSRTSNKSEKANRQTRQLLWARIAFGVFALVLILSMVLSMVANN